MVHVASERAIRAFLFQKVKSDDQSVEGAMIAGVPSGGTESVHTGGGAILRRRRTPLNRLAGFPVYGGNPLRPPKKVQPTNGGTNYPTDE